MYTKAGKIRGYIDSTYQESSIFASYALSEYKERSKFLNLIQDNNRPYMIERIYISYF